MKKLKVQVIACLSIDTNDSGIRENASILELKRGRVVSILSKLVQSFIVKPVGPSSWKTIYRFINVSWWEVLYVNRPGIM